MKKEIIDWLLDGPIWLKYAVETQLLDSRPDVGAVMQDPSVKGLVDRLRDKEIGIPALRQHKIAFNETGKAFWGLFFLADIGLMKDDLGLEKEIGQLLKLQLPDGTFKITEVDKPNYFCVSAIFLSSVAKIGYKDDARLKKYVRCILDTQRTDGGWHCGEDHTKGRKIEPTESCPMDNLNILMLLSQYDEHRDDPRFNGAVDLLLSHWARRAEKWRPSDFGIGKRFMQLEYPAVKYGILRVLDVLSFYPYAQKHEMFESMLRCVRQKTKNGRYYAESVHKAYAGFDFGQTAAPSRWITFLITRIKQRCGRISEGQNS